MIFLKGLDMRDVKNSNFIMKHLGKRGLNLYEYGTSQLNPLMPGGNKKATHT